MRNRLIFSLALVIVSNVAIATPVYKCVDAQGRKEYRQDGMSQNCALLFGEGFTPRTDPSADADPETKNAPVTDAAPAAKKVPLTDAAMAKLLKDLNSKQAFIVEKQSTPKN